MHQFAFPSRPSARSSYRVEDIHTSWRLPVCRANQFLPPKGKARTDGSISSTPLRSFLTLTTLSCGACARAASRASLSRVHLDDIWAHPLKCPATATPPWPSHRWPRRTTASCLPPSSRPCRTMPTPRRTTKTRRRRLWPGLCGHQVLPAALSASDPQDGTTPQPDRRSIASRGAALFASAM